MGASPVEDAAYLIPIGNVLEGFVFNGGACDYHAVKLTVAQFLEVDVELLHVFDRGVL